MLKPTFLGAWQYIWIAARVTWCIQLLVVLEKEKSSAEFRHEALLSLRLWLDGPAVLLIENWNRNNTRSLKPGFHYPELTPLTARVDGWPVSTNGPCWRARVSTSRVDGPSRRQLVNCSRSFVVTKVHLLVLLWFMAKLCWLFYLIFIPQYFNLPYRFDMVVGKWRLPFQQSSSVSPRKRLVDPTWCVVDPTNLWRAVVYNIWNK